MTVSKEMIQDLNIFSMSIQVISKSETNSETQQTVNEFPCVLSKFDKGILHFTLLKEKVIYKHDIKNIYILQVCIQESDSLFDSETASLQIEECGLGWVTAKMAKKPSATIKHLLNQLSILEVQEEKYGRRKEPRIKIGKEKYINFGLSSAEQKVFSKASKIIQPCAIIDASIHGICIITPFDNPIFKNLDNFCIQLSFTNPEQTVILQCHKVHSKLNNTENRVFSTLSCQLLEPIHYVWKERVMQMLEAEDEAVLSN